MAISKLCLKDFTVFENIEIDFSKGINVFIGKNGTGKTHLLKLLYFFTFNLEKGFGMQVFQEIFTEKLLDTLRNKDEQNKTIMCCTVNGREEKLTSEMWRMSGIRVPRFGGSVAVATKKPAAVFIPAKEMLSHSDGLLALDRERKIPFDKTLIDIVSKAQLGKRKNTSSFGKKLLPLLSNIINGQVVHEEGVFYVKKKDGLTIEFPMEAEGLRKFGLLWRLLQNGSINKGTVLFWDEPEANINPERIPFLVDVLLELQRSNVQVFLATHDYLLAKYFEVKRDNDDDVMFYSFFESEHGIQCRKNKYFKDLQDNPIIMAFDKLLDEVYDKNWGE